MKRRECVFDLGEHTSKMYNKMWQAIDEQNKSKYSMITKTRYMSLEQRGDGFL